MSVLLQPFQSLIGETGEIPKAPAAGDLAIHWSFGDDLRDKKAEYFNPLVEKHSVLQLSYSVQASQLAHNIYHFEKNTKQEDREEQLKVLTEQLINALAMSILLTHIYCYYLNVPSEVFQLQKAQKEYRRLLRRRGFTFVDSENDDNDDNDDNVAPPYPFTQKLRATTGMGNWPRLITVRTRRIFITLVPLLNQLDYSRVVASVDKYVGPALNHFSWVFYIPRLLGNIILLLKHTVPGPWMEPKEKDLHWFSRIDAQLQRRWFELGNDSVWLVANALGCFVLIGALAPAGMYVSVSIFFFDVVMASVRAFIELQRITKLQGEYQRLIDGRQLSTEELAEVEEHLKHLQKRSIFEQKRLYLSVTSTSLLFLAMCLALPALAFNPIIPLIGAILVLTITLATYLAGKLIEQQKPSDKIDGIAKIGATLFANSPHTFFPPEEKKQPSAPVSTPVSVSSLALIKTTTGGYI